VNYVVINSGGVGTRFWPASRKNKPKQMLRLIGDSTLLQQAKDRAALVVPPENIHICTTQDLITQTMKLLPDIPATNYIIEPCAKNTAPAIALSTHFIHNKDPEATIAFIHADHFIPQEDKYTNNLETAFNYANSNKTIVLMGINPTYPAEGYGYIKQGTKISELNNLPIHEVLAFREKPSKEQAEDYIETKQYSWNAGMFIAKSQTLIDEYKKYMPSINSTIEVIAESNFSLVTLINEYEKLEKTPIDIELIEKTSNLAMLKSDFTWEDLGSWSSLHSLYKTYDNPPETIKDSNNNIIYTKDNTYISGTNNCLIQTSRPTAIVGLENVAVIENNDILTIVNLDKDQKIKEIVSQLPDELT
jgi:mannose-1-phosphate guanylyltransferase